MCSPFTIDIRPRRLPAEIKQIEDTSNNHGIHCLVLNDSYESIEAIIPGPKETPYEEIVFKIAMEFDSHYPFRPPIAKFVTPVYHPNIDTDGKICLDVLQMPPSGSYNPAITLESILLSIQLLLASPNPDDPLRNDVSDEYRYNRELFNRNAKTFSGAGKMPVKTDKKAISETDNLPDSSDSIATPIDDEDVSLIESEQQQQQQQEPEPEQQEKQQQPNTSRKGTTAEQLHSNSKPNRKRKHDDT